MADTIDPAIPDRRRPASLEPAAARSAPYDVSALRASEFPWADRAIFMNHASLGPIPERARLALHRYNDARAAAYRITGEHLNEVLATSRILAARLINAEPAEIALTTNTSYGLQLAARMLGLRSGDIVLAPDQEFPANVYPWMFLDRLGVRLELVPLTAQGWPDESRLMERMADPRVKVLAISFVQFHTGHRANLAALSRAARDTQTYLVVDAIQGLGQIPFDVNAAPVDILSCGAQKWLLSPWGSGFTYVRRELIERLEPTFPGWTAFAGTDDYTTLVQYPRTFWSDARRFELITLPFQDFVGMNEALGLLHELSIEAIEVHLSRINQPVIDWALRRGIPLASPTGASGSGIVCLRVPSPDRVMAGLVEGGVVASYREGAVRLSPHCYNTIEEMERVVRLLDRHTG
ncbi:MAG: aminotransferase class V-fold PLP-dependent enzyme [Gemmatimonadota bacterium]